MLFAGGSGDWKQLANINDPLPQAMKMVVGQKSGWLHMLVWLGVFGLVASFHGIIMGYSRQIFALSRAGFLPSFFARIHSRFNTPYVAILAGGIFGVAVIFSDDWIKIGGRTLSANIVTMSVLGAVIMYIVSMLSLFQLRKKEPFLERPFAAPCYPLFPMIALVFSFVCLITLVYFNFLVSLLFLGMFLLCSIYAFFFYRKKIDLNLPAAEINEA